MTTPAELAAAIDRLETFIACVPMPGMPINADIRTLIGVLKWRDRPTSPGDWLVVGDILGCSIWNINESEVNDAAVTEVVGGKWLGPLPPLPASPPNEGETATP